MSHPFETNRIKIYLENKYAINEIAIEMISATRQAAMLSNAILPSSADSTNTVSVRAHSIICAEYITLETVRSFKAPVIIEKKLSGFPIWAA